MFAMLIGIFLGVGTMAFVVASIAVVVGLTLAAMAAQVFLVLRELRGRRRSGLILPMLALCVCTLSILAGLLATIRAEEGFSMSAVQYLLFYPFYLRIYNIPAALLLLERCIILKWRRPDETLV